jgi:hypothetical protein
MAGQVRGIENADIPSVGGEKFFAPTNEMGFRIIFVICGKRYFNKF